MLEFFIECRIKLDTFVKHTLNPKYVQDAQFMSVKKKKANSYSVTEKAKTEHLLKFSIRPIDFVKKQRLFEIFYKFRFVCDAINRSNCMQNKLPRFAFTFLMARPLFYKLR